MTETGTSRDSDSSDPNAPRAFKDKIMDLVNLQESEIEALVNLGINSDDDLSYIKFEDLPDMIPLVKRRKLSVVRAYLAIESKPLSDRITMKKIQ